MKIRFEADTETTWLTTNTGHDVARIERLTPEGWPGLEDGSYLSDEEWQELIDSLYRPHVACEGLDLSDDVRPGAVKDALDALRDAEKMLSGTFRELTLPGEWEPGVGSLVERCRTALSNLDPTPAAEAEEQSEPCYLEEPPDYILSSVLVVEGAEQGGNCLISDASGQTARVFGAAEVSVPVAERMVLCWNACLGLTLPPETESGALSELAHSARRLTDAYADHGYGVGEEVAEFVTLLDHLKIIAPC
jgi:hypothetical protein